MGVSFLNTIHTALCIVYEKEKESVARDYECCGTRRCRAFFAFEFSEIEKELCSCSQAPTIIFWLLVVLIMSVSSQASSGLKSFLSKARSSYAKVVLAAVLPPLALATSLSPCQACLMPNPVDSSTNSSNNACLVTTSTFLGAEQRTAPAAARACVHRQ